MRLRATTRLRNEVILAEMDARGWNQAQLARESGVSPTWLSRVVTLKFHTGRSHDIRTTSITTKRLAVFLGVEPEAIVPPELCGIPLQTVFSAVADVDVSLLLESQSERLVLPSPEIQVENADEVAFAMKYLSDRQRRVIEQRYGIGEGVGVHSLKETAKSLGVTKERVRQIQSRAELRMAQTLRRENIPCSSIPTS